jgi:signal transduction histidine kinase
MVTGLLTLVVVLLVAWRSSMRLSAPLRRLSATARRITAGSHGERVSGMEGSEAREVGEAFNRMLDELEAYRKRLVHTASLAAVGELSSSIVHEMRNPLASVKINIQALERKAGGGTQGELAEIALEQAERLERMLSELLNYSRPLELDTSGHVLAGLVGEAVEDARGGACAGTNVDIRNRVEAGIMVHADSEQLRRVLVNLLENACRALEDRAGIVEVTASEQDSPGMVRVSVADNGPGIEPERRERVFRPFHTTRENGTGLGLSNVQKIVEAHGGEISVDESPSGGALFSFTVPSGEEEQ